MKYGYGLDGMGRYAEDDDGERWMIEPYPFERWRIICRASHRLWIIRWHIGILCQHGIKNWWLIAHDELPSETGT